MSPKVSVVIPVYNVEKYLNKCVESVLKQTFQDFEVILVDDGSTDKSGEICDTYKSSQVKVIHKANGGLSDARNAGTNEAKGEFITWVDSDDTIHPCFLEVLVSMSKVDNVKLCLAELLSHEENETVQIVKPEGKYDVLSGVDALEKMLRGKLHSTSACGFIVSTELAKRFLFPVGKYHEDDFTTIYYYLNSSAVAYTNSQLYFYLQRSGSIMHKPFGKADLEELEAADFIYNTCSDISERYASAAMVKKVGNYFDVWVRNANLKKISHDTFNRIRRFFKDNFIEIMKCGDITFKRKMQIVLLRMGIYHKIKKVMG